MRSQPPVTASERADAPPVPAGYHRDVPDPEITTRPPQVHVVDGASEWDKKQADEVSTQNPDASSTSSTQALGGEPISPVDCIDPTQDLMTLIGQALDTWALRHGMENLPRDIVMEQAMPVMTQMLPFLRAQTGRARD
ncbi:hypothetical protein [Agromyces sp. Leaf222]|uniref:hypothetical protein n=1 Tax=Agromyces sp. Leaf222 TaxID=1735688 RepID=UPI0012FB75C2|nr:hypothetical protein [Agromyces sp. Leaf222]